MTSALHFLKTPLSTMSQFVQRHPGKFSLFAGASAFYYLGSSFKSLLTGSAFAYAVYKGTHKSVTPRLFQPEPMQTPFDQAVHRVVFSHLPKLRLKENLQSFFTDVHEKGVREVTQKFPSFANEAGKALRDEAKKQAIKSFANELVQDHLDGDRSDIARGFLALVCETEIQTFASSLNQHLNSSEREIIRDIKQEIIRNAALKIIQKKLESIDEWFGPILDAIGVEAQLKIPPLVPAICPKYFQRQLNSLLYTETIRILAKGIVSFLQREIADPFPQEDFSQNVNILAAYVKISPKEVLADLENELKTKLNHLFVREIFFNLEYRDYLEKTFKALMKQKIEKEEKEIDSLPRPIVPFPEGSDEKSIVEWRRGRILAAYTRVFSDSITSNRDKLINSAHYVERFLEKKRALILYAVPFYERIL